MNPAALGERDLWSLVAGSDAAADALLTAFPAGPEGASFDQLKRVKGLGEARASIVAACCELARRLPRGTDCRPVLDSPRRVAESVPAEVRAGRKEHFVAFYLDARSRLLRFETVSIGTLSASLVHPREVFAPAISHSAAGLVVAHNHPSGDCAPSAEDKDATRRLARSGELLGIPLLDHVIVADRGFFSFREHGLLS